MSIDEQLLRRQESEDNSEADASEQDSDFRATKRAELGNNDAREDDLSALKQEARIKAQQKNEVTASAESGSLSDRATTPAQQATGSCLKQAWLNLIPTWGLSLIWINIHVFLRAVLGKKLFGPLGSEWMPKKMTDTEAGKSAGKAAGIGEGMGLACLNIGCLFIIISFFALIALLVKVIENPLAAFLEFYKEIFASIWELFS